MMKKDDIELGIFISVTSALLTSVFSVIAANIFNGIWDLGEIWFLICKHGAIPLGFIIIAMLLWVCFMQISEWIIGWGDWSDTTAKIWLSKVQTFIYAIFWFIILFGMLTNLSIIPRYSFSIIKTPSLLEKMFQTLESKTYKKRTEKADQDNQEKIRKLFLDLSFDQKKNSYKS